MSWSLLFSILIGLIGIDLLVIVHETGHFLLAKAFKVDVDKVQIGFGPALVTKYGKTNTQYCLGVIPYGAFCRMDKYSLEEIHPLKKLIIYLAGPLSNILFSIICYTIYQAILKTNFFTALKLSTIQSLNELKMFLYAIGDMVTGKVKIGETLSGFFNASRNIGAITQAGFESGFMVGVETALWLSASVSVSLAFANLIPIPALDGGYILISIIEAISRHRFSEKFQTITQCFGLILLLVVLPIARLLI